jgi:hypothetical protein
LSTKKTRGKRKTPPKAARSRKPAAKKRGRKRSGSPSRRTYTHGIHATAEKFGVSTPSVTNWRRAYGITRETKKRALSGQPVFLADAGEAASGRGYSEAFRRDVAEYSILHGIQAAAEKFSVSAPSVTNWRRKFGINRGTKAAAIAAVAEGPSPAGIRKSEIRALRRQFEQALDSLDRLLAKL